MFISETNYKNIEHLDNFIPSEDINLDNREGQERQFLTAWKIVLEYYPGWTRNAELWGKEISNNIIIVAAYNPDIEFKI